MTEAETHLPTAGLVRRLMAIIYDTLLLLGVAFAYGIVVWILRKLAGDNPMEPLQGVAALIELTLLWATLAGYYVLCWIKRGQTLGMKSWRLQLQASTGSYVSVKTAWIRCLLALISAVPGGLGYLWVLFNREKGCWHDQWTESRVVVLPKEKKRRGSRSKEQQDQED